MKKNSLFWITTAVIITALAMAGCSSPSSSASAAPVTLTSITVTPATRTLEVGKTATLRAAPVPAAATLGAITWESEDKEKVTVTSAGVITAVAVTTQAVKVFAKSAANADIKGFCSVTVTEASSGNDELRLTFIPGPSFADTPPVLPAKVNNIYTFDTLFAEGNFQGGTAGTGFTDTVLVYPDWVLNGNFKFRARVKLTGFGGSTSASKGLIIGAFKGATDTGNFMTGSGGTLATAINVRNSGALRNLQSRDNDRLAAVVLNTSVTDKNEEFIYEVIRDDAGITTNMYISKTGDKIDSYSGTVPYTNASGTPDIQANTPVYAGIALCAVTATISQVQLWEGETMVFDTGNSTPAPVALKDIAIRVEGDNGKGTAIRGEGTEINPATYSIKLKEVQNVGNTFTLVPVPTPAYADITTGKFVISPTHPNDGQFTVTEGGVVTVSGEGKATVAVVSDDPIEAKYYLTISINPDYVPVGDFAVTGGKPALMSSFKMKLGTDIGEEVTDPLVTWTASPSGAVKFITSDEGGTEVENDTLTDIPAAQLVTVLAKSASAVNVTITATAKTVNASSVTTTKTAPFNVSVKAYDPVFFEWNQGDGWDLTSLKGVTTRVNGALTILAEDGTIQMTYNTRWILGAGAGANVVGSGGLGAGNANYASNAAFDLSKKYKLTIELTSTLTAAQLTVALNTEGGSDNGGPVIGMGTGEAPVILPSSGDVAPANFNGSMIFQGTAAKLSGTKTEYSVTVDPAQTRLHNSAVTAELTMDEIIGNQFFQFRINNTASGSVNIYKIKLEYVD
jgi:hypothetical protein